MRPLTLDRILQSQGFGTRRQCRALIANGAVSVAGEPVEDHQRAFDPADLRFSVDGESWTYYPKLYLALHKPPDFECSRRPSHHPGVMTLLPRQFVLRDTQAVGRLDHDTTGLLLLSDDGAFIHAQTSPRRHVAKTYLARTQDPVTAQLVAQLLAGVRLDDEPGAIAAQSCRQVGEHGLEIVLEQGKYHQVRRMLAAAGNHCAALHRSAIGRLALDALGLAPGQWCHLGEALRTQLAAD